VHAPTGGPWAFGPRPSYLAAPFSDLDGDTGPSIRYLIRRYLEGFGPASVADIAQFRFGGFTAWVLWLVVHLMYMVGFKSRVTTVFHWAISFLGRGRSQRVATQQQVYGRLALEHLGPEFEQSKTGGLADEEPTEDLTGRRSA